MMDLSRRRSFSTGRPFNRRFYLVNDTGADQEGTLRVSSVRDEPVT
ncbi:MAG: hypothetical protein LBF63_10090 [Treponema sp.]|nr:hypothetical protein [Treponema sp.]